MKNLKSISTIAIIALVAVLSFSSFKSDDNRRSRQNAKQHNDCVESITGITPDQAQAIEVLETEHQKQMEVYRTERRATTDATLKAEIRTKMDAQKETHRTQVKSLLTDEQKVEYDQLHANEKNNSKKVSSKGRGNQQQNGKHIESSNRGHGSGQGKMDGTGTGTGNGNGHRGNGQNCSK